MGSSLRLLLVAVCGALLVGCLDQPGTIAPVGSRQTSPEISGIDSDGRDLKLSDYRGKVVLVDFWRDQCLPCRAGHVHERTLVEKFKSRPFVILGVNVDADLATMRHSEQEQKLTWRSIWDGRTHQNSRAYSIMAVPTLFLFDAQGRLAKAFPAGKPDEKELDKDIEQLVKEAEQQTVAACR